jgi:hypothetical protein
MVTIQEAEIDVEGLEFLIEDAEGELLPEDQ